MLSAPPNYTPRLQASCSSVSLGNKCERAFVYRYGRGLKEPDVTWPEARRLVKPAKPKALGASRAALTELNAAHAENVKLYNRTRRKTLGKESHAILEWWAASFKVPCRTCGLTASAHGTHYKGSRGCRKWDPEPTCVKCGNARRLHELTPLEIEQAHGLGADVCLDFQLVDWHDVPGRTALAGLHHIPHPTLLAEYRYIERPVSKGPMGFVARVSEGRLDYEWNGFIDYVVKLTADKWPTVIDYKTTSSFGTPKRTWIKTPAELQEDEQGICYPLDVMFQFNVEQVKARWIYFRTEGPPQTRAIDFVQTRELATKRALPLVQRGAELIDLLAHNPRPEDTPGNPAACEMFGGCVYHSDRGGPCDARPSWGKRLKANSANTTKEKEEIMAGFRRNAEAAGAIAPRGGAAPRGPGRQPRAQPQTQSAPEGEEEAAQGGEEEQTQAAPRRQAAAPRGGARRAAAPAPEPEQQDDLPISLMFGDDVIAIPGGSPLYAQARAIYDAFFPG